MAGGHVTVIGAGEWVAGRLLGHSKPETTQRYTALPGDALRNAVAGVGVA